MKTKKSTILTSIAVLLIASIVLAACGGGATQAPETEVPSVSDIDCTGVKSGDTITMLYQWSGLEEEKITNILRPFVNACGVTLKPESTRDQALLDTRVKAGTPPDIAFWQVTQLNQYKDILIPLTDLGVHVENYPDFWKDLGTVDGKWLGLPVKADPKTMIWYSPKNFSEAGYTIPTTWDELDALVEKMVADGKVPWSMGFESGDATGWTMTDWIEDVMLRVTSPENYDAWVAGELKFNSPEVNLALDYIEEIWFNDAYVYGGRKAIPTINFGDAPKPMFEDPPKCWFNRQGNFVTTFFPEEAVPGVDYSFFYFPPIDPQYGKPVLGAGDIYAVFNDRPEVRAVIQYFSTGESLKVWVESGGAILTHNDADLNWYVDPVTRGVAETIRNATVFRFDGSDMMPGAVGAGTFWKYMTDYVSGSITRQEALDAIDASWPR